MLWLYDYDFNSRFVLLCNVILFCVLLIRAIRLGIRTDLVFKGGRKSSRFQ